MLEDSKYQEFQAALKNCNNGNNSMLHEYNYRGFNPYYQGNAISKWLEEILRQGDLVSEDRIGDLILREVDKGVEEYTASTVQF
jgi:hypothetical protein